MQLHIVVLPLVSADSDDDFEETRQSTSKLALAARERKLKLSVVTQPNKCADEVPLIRKKNISVDLM